MVTDRCFSGPFLHYLELSSLSSCRSAISSDHVTHGYRCVNSLLKVKEIDISYDSEITRLVSDARKASGCSSGDAACMENADTIIFSNATILTMASGKPEQDLISNGVVIVKNGVIREVGKTEEIDITEGATLIDVQGGKLWCRPPDSKHLNPYRLYRSRVH